MEVSCSSVVFFGPLAIHSPNDRTLFRTPVWKNRLALLGCRNSGAGEEQGGRRGGKNSGKQGRSFAREEEVCAREVNWEQSLFMTGTDFPREEGSTSSSPLPRFPTPVPEKLQSGETTTVCVHSHMSHHGYSHLACKPAEPWGACPPHPLRHYPQKPAPGAQ